LPKKNRLKLQLQRSISPTYLRAAFMPIAFQSVQTKSSHQFFALLGSTRLKDVRRMLVKLTPGKFHITLECKKAARKKLGETFCEQLLR